MKVYFIVLVGLPASGKTFTCRHLVNRLKSTNSACVHIEFDKYITGIDDFKESRSVLLEKIETLVESLHGNSDSREIVTQFLPDCQTSYDELSILFDDNMYYRSMRYEVYKLARSLCHPPNQRVHFLQIFLKTSLDNSLQSNAQRQGAELVPSDVIQRMALRLEEPDTTFWERSTLVLHDREALLERLDRIHQFMTTVDVVIPQELVDSTKKDAETKRESARNETFTNSLHQCEISVRQLISSQLSRSDLSASEKKQRSDLLQKIKKDVMDEVKTASFLSVDDAKNFALSLFSSYLAQNTE